MKTYGNTSKLIRQISTGVIVIAAIMAINGAWADVSAQKPAVSDINAKLSFDVADFDAASAIFGTAAVTFPMTQRIGFALDGLAGDYSANSLWGIGGNLFWRDPDQGLIGIIASQIQIGAATAKRNGLYAEYYMDQFSFIGDLGYQSADTAKDAVFSDFGIKWYIMGNLAVGASCAYSSENLALVTRIEYMPAKDCLPGIAFFLNGSLGESSYTSIAGGVRYYFGSDDKTLQKRHREDDPENTVLNGLIYGAQGGLGETIRPNLPTEEEIR
jgi:hypothetical protein